MNNEPDHGHLPTGALASLAREVYASGPLVGRTLQRLRPLICPLELVIRHVPPGARVLDVGCGGGVLLALLARLGRIESGLGVDASAPAIRTARAMLHANAASDWSARLRFELRPVQAGLPDDRFDAVTMIDVLHHIEPRAQESAIAAAASRVAPRGVLVFKDMARRPAWRAAANRAHDLLVARQWIHYAPIDRVEAWAKSRGLRPVHAADVTRLWYGHELRVFAHDAGSGG